MFTDHFLTGNYQQQIDSNSASQNKPTNIISNIGSYSFLGQTLEAITVLNLSKNLLNADQLCSCYFFIAISSLRKSKFKQAVGYIKKIKYELIKNKSNNEIRFYYNQSYSIFFFYIGNHKKALKYSIRAYKLSLSISSIYHRSLASDLLGHCYIKNKSLFLGLKMLETAHHFAKLINNKSFANALEISILVYKSQHGIDYTNLLVNIIDKINKIETEDSYSKLNLNLELAYLHLMQGSFFESKKTLDSIFPSLVSSENKRQMLSWSLTHSLLCLFMNDLNQAESSLHQAQKLILKVKDQHLINRIELQSELIKKIKFQDYSSESTIDRTQCSFIKTYFQSYYHLFSDESALKREFVEYSASADPLKFIINNKMYIWLYTFLPANFNNIFILHSNKYKNYFFINSQSIRLYSNRLTNQILKLLILFQDKKNLSKQDIFEKVWDMKYSKRHDTIIYGLIKKVRNQFKDIGFELIQNTHYGYTLTNSIEVINIDDWLSEKKSNVHKIVDSNLMVDSFYKNLEPFKSIESDQLSYKNSELAMAYTNSNIKLSNRQLAFLTYLKSISKHEFNISMYRTHCQISNMSAYRDIVDLLTKNVIIKSGFAKLTKYKVIRTV